MRSFRLFFSYLRRFLAPFVVVAVVGCSAQTPETPKALERRIHNEIRTQLGVPPNVEITLGQRHESKISGYDTLPVTLSAGDRKLELQLLISKDNKTLARLETFNLAEDVMAKIDVKGRPVRGNPEAKVTIVNFDDFQCPFCSRMHETLMGDILKDYGDKIRIIYKDYPLTSIHPWAMRAAINANCLNAQKSAAYWEYADYVHANHELIMGPQEKRRPQSEQVMALDKAAFDQAHKHGLDARKVTACVQAQDQTEVRASMAEAEGLKVESTPTLFVNGERMSGALPESVMRAILDRALRAEGITPPPPKEQPKVNIVPTPGALPK